MWVCGKKSVDSEDEMEGFACGKYEMWVMCIRKKTLSTGRKPLKYKDFLEKVKKECEYMGKVIHILSTFCG